MVSGQPTDEGRKKNLITSVSIQYDPFKQLFNCGNCSDEDKKYKGCDYDLDFAVMSPGCYCDGDNNCDICEGKGFFELRRCPARVNRKEIVRKLLPFFYHWKATSYVEYPDGGCRLDQPAGLLEAFSLLCNVSTNREIEEIKSRNKYVKP